MAEMQSKKEKRFGVVLGSVVGVVLLAVIIITLFALNSEAVTPAYLNVEGGTVEVNTGSGWQTASDGMALSLNDRIRTGGDGAASVILYESAIVSLDPGTEISIAELDQKSSKIEQASGSTWNKFTKLNGMEGLEVETPNSVATVRGTEFEVNASAGEVLVMEGEVETTDKVTGNKYSVPAGQKAARLEGKLALEGLSDAEKDRLIRKMEQNVKRLEHLAEKQKQKHTKLEEVVTKKQEKLEAKIQESKKQIETKKQEKALDREMKKETQKENKGNQKPQITGLGNNEPEEVEVLVNDETSRGKSDKSPKN